MMLLILPIDDTTLMLVLVVSATGGSPTGFSIRGQLLVERRCHLVLHCCASLHYIAFTSVKVPSCILRWQYHFMVLVRTGSIGGRERCAVIGPQRCAFSAPHSVSVPPARCRLLSPVPPAASDLQSSSRSVRTVITTTSPRPRIVNFFISSLMPLVLVPVCTAI